MSRLTLLHRTPLGATTRLLILDALAVLAHYLNGWRYSMFNLDIEHNLPTLYQSLKYQLLAALAWGAVYFYHTTGKSRRRVYFWTGLALLLTWLGADELGMLHEFLLADYLLEIVPAWDDFQRAEIYTRGYNLTSSRWIIAYAALGLLLSPLLIWWASLGVRIYKTRLWPVALGVAILAVVVGVEYYNTSGIDPRYYNRFITIEEGLEMLAISVAGLFVFQTAHSLHHQLQNTLARVTTLPPQPQLPSPVHKRPDRQCDHSRNK